MDYKELKQMTEWYSNRVFEEMLERGYTESEALKIIDKTGFRDALEKYPEEQLHDSISDAVDEILFVAAAA